MVRMLKRQDGDGAMGGPKKVSFTFHCFWRKAQIYRAKNKVQHGRWSNPANGTEPRSFQVRNVFIFVLKASIRSVSAFL